MIHATRFDTRHVLTAVSLKDSNSQSDSLVYGPCTRAYLLVLVTAVGPGTATLYLEFQDEDDSQWYQLTSLGPVGGAIENRSTSVECPPDSPTRLRWVVGAGGCTFGAKLLEVHDE